MNLKKVFSPVIAATLEQKLPDARSTVDAAQAAYNAAALAAEDNPSADTAAAREKARSSLQQAEAELANLAAALDGARARDAQSAAAQSEKAEAQRWSEAEALAKRSAALAAEVDQAAQALARGLSEL